MGIPIVDAIGDPCISDAVIGDGPEDIITLQASVCISPDASISYMEGSFDSDRCWTVDLRRAPLP
jgi:hypothetical protein